MLVHYKQYLDTNSLYQTQYILLSYFIMKYLLTIVINQCSLHSIVRTTHIITITLPIPIPIPIPYTPHPYHNNNTWPLKRGFDRASHMIYWMLAMWQNDHLYHKDNYILEQFISTSNIWKFKFQVILFLKWRNLLANLFEVERETNSVFKTNETDQIDLIIGIDMLKYNEFYSFIFRPI